MQEDNKGNTGEKGIEKSDKKMMEQAGGQADALLAGIGGIVCLVRSPVPHSQEHEALGEEQEQQQQPGNAARCRSRSGGSPVSPRRRRRRHRVEARP